MQSQTNTIPGEKIKQIVLIAPFRPWDSFRYTKAGSASPLCKKQAPFVHNSE
jgi:hypothetical protein